MSCQHNIIGGEFDEESCYSILSIFHRSGEGTRPFWAPECLKQVRGTIMCPYAYDCRHICHVNSEHYEACARYQLAHVIGIQFVPQDMTSIDYAKISELIRKWSCGD